MVDQLVGCDENGSRTTLLIRDDNVLVYNGELTEAGLIENIAQTAAAGVGYIALQAGGAVSTGYIGAIKNLEVVALPKLGDVITTAATIEKHVFDVTMIAGAIKCNGKLIAKCEMKIFIKKQPKSDQL